MQASAVPWLPNLRKQPRRLSWAETEASMTRADRIGWAVLLILMEGIMLVITAATLYGVAVTPTQPWTMADGVFLAVCNLMPAALACIVLLVMPGQYTVCPQGHITIRSKHSRHCYQCGFALLDRVPL
jgi:hypothetical protein